jgi:hypothetical protein
MTEIEKKNYNKLYYQKNREKILERAKATPAPRRRPLLNVIPLFKNKIEQSISKPTFLKIFFKCSIETLFLQIFVAMMTYFLVSESADFYISVDGNRAGAYLKALILEGAVIAFSLMRTRSVLLSAAYKGMIVLVYLYSIWAISGSVIHGALKQRTEAALHQKSVQEIEHEIQQKEIIRDRYFQTDRITLARKYDLDLNGLKQKLDETRQSVLKVPNQIVIWNTLATLVVFRILVMLSNVLCVQELGRRHRLRPKTV